MEQVLIVYFSRSGNTKKAAEMIHACTQGALFRVETAEPYSENYQECAARAVAEWKGDARPEIRGGVADLERYERVFVCYPLWCGTMPMGMFTFLQQHDLTGKRLYPLCTNEGSGFANSIRDLEKLCPGAQVCDGLEVKGSKVPELAEQIHAWAMEKVAGN